MARGDVLRTFPAPGGIPFGLGFDGRALLHVDAGLASIFQLDPRTGAQLAQKSVLTFGTGIVLFGGNWFYSDDANNLIRQVLPGVGPSALILRSFTPGTTPRGLTFDTRTLFNTDGVTDDITQREPRAGTVMRTLPGSAQIAGIACDERTIYTSDAATNLITAHDIRTGAIQYTFAAPGPQTTGIVKVGATLYICDNGTNTIAQVRLQ